MKLFGFSIALILLLSIGFAFVPSRIKIDAFSPQVDCLISNGFSVENNCSYNFEVVKKGSVLRVLKRGEVVSSSKLFAGCGSSDCFLQHEEDKVSFFLSFEEGTEKINSFLLLVFSGSVFSALFVLFNYLKNKKTSFKMKLLFIASVLIALASGFLLITAG